MKILGFLFLKSFLFISRVFLEFFCCSFKFAAWISTYVYFFQMFFNCSVFAVLFHSYVKSVFSLSCVSLVVFINKSLALCFFSIKQLACFPHHGTALCSYSGMMSLTPFTTCSTCKYRFTKRKLVVSIQSTVLFR